MGLVTVRPHEAATHRKGKPYRALAPHSAVRDTGPSPYAPIFLVRKKQKSRNACFANKIEVVPLHAKSRTAPEEPASPAFVADLPSVNEKDITIY